MEKVFDSQTTQCVRLVKYNHKLCAGVVFVSFGHDYIMQVPLLVLREFYRFFTRCRVLVHKEHNEQEHVALTQ